MADKKISQLYAENPIISANMTLAELVELVSSAGASGAADLSNIADAIIKKKNLLTDYSVSLLYDSGRFDNGISKGSVITNPFVFPAYMDLLSGSTVASIGKFIYDNSTYGGAGGALVPEIKDLVDKIRAVAYRRYDNEYYVARITMGSGTSSPVTYEGLQYYLSSRLVLGPYPPASTFHCYLRAETNRIVGRVYPGQTIFKNGVMMSGNVAIDPSDGWVSFMLQGKRDPYTSYSHNPTPFTMQARDNTSTYLMACPSLLGGLVSVDPNQGVIVSAARWLP